MMEKPVDTKKAERYVALLDEFDSVDRNAFDLQGRTWQRFHPDPDIREEGVVANKAYTAILSAVLSSSAIADNILKLEKAELDIGDMVKSPETVRILLNDLRRILAKPAATELFRMKALARDRGVANFQIWDVAYGQNLLKNAALPHFDARQTLQYLAVDRVVPSLIHTVETLFELRFKYVNGVTAWHPRVTVFEVRDAAKSPEQLVGRVFLDLYARSGKNEGIGATTVRKSIKGKQLGEMIVSANFVDAPQASMSFEDARTIFGALGHCVHVMMARQNFARMAGLDSVEAEFSGVSGQLLHSWFCDRRVFECAVNDKGEPMPEGMLADMVTAGEIGRATIRMESLVAAEMSVSSTPGILAERN